MTAVTPDPKVDVTDAVTIKVGGREWYIPVLPLRQTVKIVPLAAKLTGLSVKAIAEEHADAVVRIVHIALSRAYPAVTLDELYDTMRLDELVAAIPVVLGQTGALKLVDRAAGEAPAASLSTGSGSSPTS
jgi:hypothetical protein